MLIGFLTGFLASVFGWQINLIAIQKGIDSHKRAAFLVGLGAAFADLAFIYGYFTGANLLLVAHPQYWVILKWVGIATIFGLSMRLLLKTPRVVDWSAPKRPGAKRYFLFGFLVVISNPAVFFAWIGVMSFILTHFPQASTPHYKWFFMGGFLAGASAWFLYLVLHLHKMMMSMLHPKALAWLSRITAILLLGACLFLAFHRI
ncbi:MAG: LysE family transporter [Candidatus Omnitrophota bacterium]|jgi:threonine/homoserine/homoserine lactone efflux protein